MKIWKDKSGKWIDAKEFLTRWKQGIEKVSPEFQLNVQIKSTWISLIGIVCGLIITFFNLKQFWWLSLILTGALGNVTMQLVSLIQKQKIEKGFSSLIDSFDNFDERRQL